MLPRAIFPDIKLRLLVSHFGYPIEAATQIAVEAVQAWGLAKELPNDITFCCVSAQHLDVYLKITGQVENGE